MVRQIWAVGILGLLVCGCGERDWAGDPYRSEFSAAQIAMVQSGLGLEAERLTEWPEDHFGVPGGSKPEYVFFEEAVTEYLETSVETRRSISGLNEKQERAIFELIDQFSRDTDYAPEDEAICSMKPGIRLHFEQGESSLDVYICMACKIAAYVEPGEDKPFLFVPFEKIDGRANKVIKLVFDEDPKGIR